LWAKGIIKYLSNCILGIYTYFIAKKIGVVKVKLGLFRNSILMGINLQAQSLRIPDFSRRSLAFPE
jgi:cytochrome c biogenesis protein CcdA